MFTTIEGAECGSDPCALILGAGLGNVRKALAVRPPECTPDAARDC